MTQLLVNEIFWSIQGEGHFTGTPAVFVRLQGCDVRCPWCDTGYALDVRAENRLSDNSTQVLAKLGSDPRYTAADADWLVGQLLARKSPIRHLVLTGGEPFMQDIVPLLERLEREHFMVQVETSGTRPLPAPALERTWITLSPKLAKLPLPENWERANELKIPVLHPSDLTVLAPFLEKLEGLERLHRPLVSLQPVSQNREATRLCIELCMKNNWKLSLQTHKFIDLR